MYSPSPQTSRSWSRIIALTVLLALVGVVAWNSKKPVNNDKSVHMNLKRNDPSDYYNYETPQLVMNGEDISAEEYEARHLKMTKVMADAGFIEVFFCGHTALGNYHSQEYNGGLAGLVGRAKSGGWNVAFADPMSGKSVQTIKAVKYQNGSPMRNFADDRMANRGNLPNKNFERTYFSGDVHLLNKMRFTCDVNRGEGLLPMAAKKAVYWACGNGAGLHVMPNQCTWTYSIKKNVQFAIYVKPGC